MRICGNRFLIGENACLNGVNNGQSNKLNCLEAFIHVAFCNVNERRVAKL